MTIDKEMPILIVDDNKLMRRIVRFCLADLGFNNIVEATNGVEALQTLETTKIALILSDWNMEPMDGLTFLKEAKKREKLKNIPFIMITAESTRENVIAAAQAGVSNYILKPFTSETLKVKMEKVLGKI